jgi:carbonic anhydrase
MSETDRLLAAAARYAPEYRRRHPDMTPRPSLGITIVACMDARLDLFALFGLSLGQVHMIRNAGGLVTDDTIRSLSISQRFLGTTEILLVHHTGCGLYGLDDESFARDLETETGTRPSWRAGGFEDAHEDVRRSIEIIRTDPFIPCKGSVRGFVFDVADGTLTEAHAGP